MLKKYTIAIAAISASVVLASAAEAPQQNSPSSNQRPGGQMVRQGEGMPQMMVMPTPMTGDKATDEKIKVLQKEMEDKINAIREDYRTKIRAVIGTRRVINYPNATTTALMRGERFENASGTRGTSSRSMMERARENDGRREDRNASGTPREGRPMMMQGGSVPRGPEVRGASTEVGEGEHTGGIINFFGRFFR